MRSALLLGCLLLAACATTGPGGGTAHPGSLDLQGTLGLSDGTPVADAPLTARCGALEQAVRTDEAGRFVLRRVAEGECTLSCPGFSRRVRVSAGLLGGRLDLRLPPAHRVTLESGADRALVIDETIPQSLRLWAQLSPSVGLAEVQPGQQLKVGPAKVKVVSVEKRPWLPLALRHAPPADAFQRVPVLTSAGQLVRPALGLRTLVLAGSCEQLRVEALDELEALAVSHDAAGLRVIGLLTEACPARHAAGQVLLAGPEALWALGARSGEAVVLDGAGRPARRLPSVDEARAYLARTWPAFAASSKVSVAPSATVLEAEADRLLAQARAKEKAGRHDEAHQLLDQVLKLSPDLAEARKERALLKAKRGDLSGALREVSWWRTSFGADSADDLLEELERTAKVSTLR
jgi:hypothetical protein